jgi:hypothetical protein
MGILVESVHSYRVLNSQYRLYVIAILKVSPITGLILPNRIIKKGIEASGSGIFTSGHVFSIGFLFLFYLAQAILCLIGIWRW